MILTIDDIREHIIIKGARQHNLKDVNLEIPRDKLVVLTGVSGSGKSSLAFDTIFAEGQRRYIESLSAYARQFMSQLSKPDVDSIEGLSPAVSISQKTTSYNPRSTVGTVTEIYDFMRVLFARVGTPNCPNCKIEIKAQTVNNIIQQILKNYSNKEIMILAPIIRDRKGEYKKELKGLLEAGLSRVRIDYEIKRLDEMTEEEMILSRYYRHTIEAIIDRLIVTKDETHRLAESIEHAVELSDGLVIITTSEASQIKRQLTQKKETKKEEIDEIDRIETEDSEELGEILFSIHLACPKCGLSFPKLEPRNFSFNSIHGACDNCKGLGSTVEIDPDYLVVDKDLSLEEGALADYDPSTQRFRATNMRLKRIKAIVESLGFSINTPLRNISEELWNDFFYGPKKPLLVDYHFTWEDKRGGIGKGSTKIRFSGIGPIIMGRFKRTSSQYIRDMIQSYTSPVVCPVCAGSGLRRESQSVYFKGRNIAELAGLSITECMNFFESIQLTATEKKIAQSLLKEITMRLQFLIDVGLPYLTLMRRANSLSGGESQRIRLGTQIGSSLENVLYILDEPSIGLHNRDNLKLINTLQSLRDKGNTVLVSEHDIDTMLAADWLIDIGPKAGNFGGEIIIEGPASVVAGKKQSITGKYLSGEEVIKVPKIRRKGNGKILTVFGAAEHNLKKINVEFPLGLFICVTGVSGSGKSSLVSDILWRALARTLNRAKTKPGKHDHIEGAEFLDKVIEIDQSPIGYTPRSVPATYTKVLDHIRDFYASIPISKARGFKKGRYSFNTKQGRCSACNGLGYNRIEMQFLPDIEVECEVCEGKRFSAETLEIKYRDKNIQQVLDMTVSEAIEFFQDHPKIAIVLQTMQDVGLGYIKLGQSSTTLSGGEAQRIKISRELSKKATGKTLYILEEPTVGLHSYDVNNLLLVLNRLVDAGNTVIVVEHNLDVIKCADWIIDLGPEGGDNGGDIIAAGTPEVLAKIKNSYTGIAIQKVLTDKQIIKPNFLEEKQKVGKDKAKTRKTLTIIGARKNNLKNINVKIPKNKLTVITGISGSGKSSLALDTIFAEGQRRFVESLSTYARQFLGRMDNADVDKIEGLSPAIAIDQKSAGRNPRSTVGTVTEINDYLRLLFASVGIGYCPKCGKDISPLTLEEIVKRTLQFGDGTRVKIIAPLVKKSKGNYKPLIKELIKEGFTRIIIDEGTEVLLDDIVTSDYTLLDKDNEHTIDLIVDRLAIDSEDKGQIFESIETALHKGNGVVKITVNGDSMSFSTKRLCFDCGVELPEKFTPKMFSFNHHIGACEKCKGLGVVKSIDPDLFIIDSTKSIRQGAIGPISENKDEGSWLVSLLKSLGEHFGFTLDTPINKLTKEQYQILFYGSDQILKLRRDIKRKDYAYTYERERQWRGLIPIYENWLANTKNFWFINWMEKYTRIQICSDCNGSRLKPDWLAVRIGGLNINQVTKCSIIEAKDFFSNLSFGGADQVVAEGLVEEILNRLGFLVDVGLDYLTLDREARTLSGGEAQRIRLATQIGNKLVGVLYVLDEPSIGLHPRDNNRLINTLYELRDLGNSVVVIEHDEATIRSADHIIDLGPGAGVNGGRVVAEGTLKVIMDNEKSLTGKYLSGHEEIKMPKKRRKGKEFLTIEGVNQNNLQNITVKFPLGVFNCVTGVSGSGKSSLVIETLYPVLAKAFHKSKKEQGNYTKIDGLDHLDKVVLINQDPIGRTPRSNPATYTGLFDHIRDLFARLPEAKIRGFTNSRFSYNNSKGRCPICRGRGIKEVEMLFLSNVEIICEECVGRRYNRETLTVKFKDKSIADVLEMTIEDAIPFFKNQPKILKILKVMDEVGLGYLQLGQSATTLSGGEAQRVKLASELCRPQTTKTLYLLDEPTVGLAAFDVHKLMNILQKLVNDGNTVIIIEHNLDVIKCADWVIDLGPDGGDKGGRIIAEGTPEQVSGNTNSITGRYLQSTIGSST